MTCKIDNPVPLGVARKRTCTSALHALQRVQRDRSARVRAFLRGDWARAQLLVSDWTELPLGRLGEPLQQPVKDVRPVKLKGMLTSPLRHHDSFVIGHGDS
jgi:hypothetical protein